MDEANLRVLRREWESAVAAHAAMYRDAATRGLTHEEIAEVGSAYVLRIDAAYARLKLAEAGQAVSSHTA